MGRIPWLVAGAAVAASAYAAGPAARTAITVFTAPPDATTAQGEFGGTTYGTPIVPPAGALVTERRDVDVGAGEVRLTGVPDTLDPASVQLRGVNEPIAVNEQRFVPGATTIEEVMARHVGEQVTVTTPKGDVTGTLRAVDPLAIVVETAGGLRVLRRDGYVLDVKLPGGANAAQPELVWRLAGAHGGKQPVEITYRADGMSWSADYNAVFDPAQKTLDFSAWATVKNATTASFDGAELTLVDTSVGPAVSAPSKTATPIVRAPSGAPSRFVVPGLVKLGAGETVQVALAPPRIGVKVRPVVTFEAMPDPSANFQQFQAVDCNQLSAQLAGAGHAEVALELDTPGQLPAGKVRLFERTGSRLDVISEDQLHASPNLARIRLASDSEIVGERHATSCNYDEHARTIREKVELSLENHGKQRVTVIAREFMWRWPMWHLEGDELPKGTRAGPQTQEYRFDLGPGGKQLVSYTVVYAW
ncbi:MAG TPA: DUF4139 domain-containing protein [Kofleriaceae bacterium]